MSLKFLAPVDGPKGARFGQGGAHWANKHTGLDFRVGSGTEVRASEGGNVILTPGHPSYGIQLIIDHGNGYRTRYAHLSRKVVFAGRVTQGQVIALSGNTGNSTGPHLHFEIIINGRPVDPERYLGGVAPPGDDGGGIQSPGDLSGLGTLTDSGTWMRVGAFIGGVAFAGVGAYFMIGEL